MVRLFALLLGLSVSAQAQDLLGQRYSRATFPLCQSFGCREVARDGGSVRLQLLRQDARLTLVLSPYGTVMGLEAWVTAPKLSASQRGFLETLAERAAEQNLDLPRLRQCWAEVRAGQVQRILGGGGEHYGVACLRRSAGGLNHWGLRVYFDH